MSSVDQLFADYMAEHRAGGEADPNAFLTQAAPADRHELALLIDAYLARAPRAPFDEAAFRGTSDEETVDALQRSIGGVSGLWPAMLPGLRAAAGLRRRELVERLAAALDAPDRQEKVGRYYHEMEQGLLAAEGVSDRVLEALARLTGTKLAALREAGRAVVNPAGGPSGAATVFARAVQVDAADDMPLTASGPAQGLAPDEPWDEVDELFCGAPESR